MIPEPYRHLDTLIGRYPVLAPNRDAIAQAFELMACCYETGGQLLIAGNGGSAADAGHIVGELMKSFCRPRPMPEAFRQAVLEADPVLGRRLGEGLQQGLPALALGAHTALATAWTNDCDPDLVYAQQVAGYGHEGDVLLALSTSGNSTNILCAALAARAKGLRVIGLTGAHGGRLAEKTDCCIRVPETETYKVQELHLPVYHCLCLMLEEAFFA
ncbi:MAG: SIS domain-containing protein [Bacteroidales bacterium]|nr:SIS domain-containing protein [Bacteroidales bacterium]